MSDIDYMEAEMRANIDRRPFEGDEFVVGFSVGWRAACEAAHAKANAENAALRRAIADAIRSPMGVVPASAERFYDQTKGEVMKP